MLSLWLFPDVRAVSKSGPSIWQSVQVPAKQSVCKGRPRSRLLSGSGISDANDEDNPERVIPIRTEEAIAKGALLHIFPHESVSVIALHR